MNNFTVERPKTSLTELAPIFTLAAGLSLLLVIGSCLVVLILRCTCTKKTKRKDVGRSESSTIRTVSPENSEKSTTSKEVDGNESDEKNPDVIPDTTELDLQVIMLPY